MADSFRGILQHFDGIVKRVWTRGQAVPLGTEAVVIRPRRGHAYWRPIVPGETVRDMVRDYLSQHSQPGRHDGWIVARHDGKLNDQWYFTVADQMECLNGRRRD